MGHERERLGRGGVDDIGGDDAQAPAQFGELVDERDVDEAKRILEQLRSLGHLHGLDLMRRHLRLRIQRDRQVEGLGAQGADDPRDLAQVGAAARVEPLRCVRDHAPLRPQPRGEVAGEADRHRAGDHHQPVLGAEALRRFHEMVEGSHAVLAGRREVGEAEDESVGRLEILDPRRQVGRAAQRADARLRDVIANGLKPGALPEGEFLRSDGAEADDADSRDGIQDRW